MNPEVILNYLLLLLLDLGKDLGLAQVVCPRLLLCHGCLLGDIRVRLAPLGVVVVPLGFVVLLIYDHVILSV